MSFKNVDISWTDWSSQSTSAHLLNLPTISHFCLTLFSVLWAIQLSTDTPHPHCHHRPRMKSATSPANQRARMRSSTCRWHAAIIYINICIILEWTIPKNTTYQIFGVYFAAQSVYLKSQLQSFWFTQCEQLSPLEQQRWVMSIDYKQYAAQSKRCSQLPASLCRATSFPLLFHISPTLTLRLRVLLH